MRIKHVLFLYTRLADYFYKCVEYFLDNNDDYIVTIVCYPRDLNAPFVFPESERLRIVSSESLESVQDFVNLAENHNTVGIFVSGWSDKKYLKVAKYFFGKIPTIMGIDNAWEGTLRQQAGVLVYKNILRNIYSHIWCCGMPQIDFANRLGFRQIRILKSLYSANTPAFEKVYHDNLIYKSSVYPKKILYVGRYVEYKKPLMLVKIFSQLVKENRHNGWRLELVGSGDLRDELVTYQNECIEINNFVSPNELPQKLGQAGAFCLPSQSEHWGVVVHEAVSTGLPLIVSDTVYSCSEFLINGYNGWSFETNNEQALELALKMLLSKSAQELLEMSKNSFELSKRVSQSHWQSYLKSALNNV